MKFFDLQLLLHRHNRFNPMPTIPPAAIAFYDFTVLLSGTITYVIDGEKVRLNAGDAIFIPQGAVRLRERVENCDYISVNFTGKEDFSRFPLLAKRFVDKEFLHLLAAYDEHFRNRSLHTVERFKEYVRLFLIKMEEFSERAQFSGITEEILLYLQNNLSKRLSLEDVGNHTHFSPIYCATLFKKETGASIIQYFNQLKIERAKLLLEEGELSLLQIAEEVGFDDYNYFTRLFKKFAAYTPSQYRQRFSPRL